MKTSESLRHISSVFRAYFGISVAVQVQYQAATFIWLIGSVLEPLIYLVVWTLVARLQGGSVGGITTHGFAAYYIALMLLNHWTFTWIMWEYELLIRDGTLARRLMRPVHPVVNDVADNVAYKVLASTALIPAAVLMILFFEPHFGITGGSLVAFLPAFLMAFALRFTLEWTLALAAFWTTRTSALNQVYYGLMMFLSGRVAPLELLPGFVRTAANLLPFRWMISFPLDVLLGKSSAPEVLRGYLVQAGWIVVCLAASRLVWRSGVRQFSAVGS
jgi:ABC-2 type transport system permease protein